MRALFLGLVLWLFPQGHALVQEPGQDQVGVDEKLGDELALDAVFADEDGKPVTLRRLVDRPTVLTLNYFACAGICTPLLHGLTDALNRLKREPGRDFKVVTLSFDERDTPEIAKMKRTNYLREMRRPFPPEAWRFITGKNPAIRKLTDSVGFGYKAYGREYAHPGVVVLLSPQGIVTRYIYGTSFQTADLEMAIDEAGKGVVRPTVVKALSFCFSYDPRGRRYVLNGMKVGGTLTMLFGLGFGAWLAWGGRKA
ncbi:MAG: SCO family protein [Elusimicrobiota bacterium]|jgi:protein SCO1/2